MSFEQKREHDSSFNQGQRSTFFILGDGIDKEVITTDICRYLGNDASVLPGSHTDPRRGQTYGGFYVAAYRPLSKTELDDLRNDSKNWRAEKIRLARREQNVNYETSATRTERDRLAKAAAAEPRVTHSYSLYHISPGSQPVQSYQDREQSFREQVYTYPGVQLASAPGDPLPSLGLSHTHQVHSYRGAAISHPKGAYSPESSQPYSTTVSSNSRIGNPALRPQLPTAATADFSDDFDGYCVDDDPSIDYTPLPEEFVTIPNSYFSPRRASIKKPSANFSPPEESVKNQNTYFPPQEPSQPPPKQDITERLDQLALSDGPPRPRPTRPQSVPAQTEGNLRDITIISPRDGSRRSAVALLDTGCLTGNWISAQLVQKLHSESLVTSNPSISMIAANGGQVKSQGTVNLDWRWSLKGIKVHTTTFHLFDAPHHDVILGNEFLKSENLMSWNEDSFSPLIEHNPAISPYESEDMRQARMRQEQEKADREAARKRAQGTEERNRVYRHRR